MGVSWQMLLIVCPLIFVASLVDSIGGGGGLISLPAYLVAGLPPVLAAGTNKLSACFGTFLASFAYLRKGKLVVKIALTAVAGALPGSFLGAELLKIAPEEFVRTFMLAAIPVAAVVLLLHKKLPETPKPLTAKRLWLCFLTGLVCGFYDGFFGPGTGTFLILMLSWIVGLDAVTASGTAKLINLSSNAAALISFLIGGNVLFALGVPAMAFSAAGGLLGARLAMRGGAKLIRTVMLLVLALLLGKLLLDRFAG